MVTAWITNPSKVYDLMIRLVVLIPHAIMKWQKDQEKVTEKGKFSPHASLIGFQPLTHIGTL